MKSIFNTQIKKIFNIKNLQGFNFLIHLVGIRLKI